MKLWILSDMHADRGIGDIAARSPAFDALICAGDVVSGDVAMSIEMVAAIARGKPAIFVAGNHEWMGSIDKVLASGRAAAERHHVHWLELESVELGGIKFAGATWTPLDARYAPERTMQACRYRKGGSASAPVRSGKMPTTTRPGRERRRLCRETTAIRPSTSGGMTVR